MWKFLLKLVINPRSAFHDVREKNQEVRRSMRQFWSIAKPYWTSEVKWKAIGLLSLVLMLTASVNGLNVAINFIAGNWQTVMKDLDKTHDLAKFYGITAQYMAIFVVGTPIVVFNSWLQDKLNLHWRTWLTKHMLDKYMKDRNYYKISNDPTIDNPDERMAADVSSFCSYSLSISLSLMSAVLQLGSFILILWTLSPLLTGAVFGYAIVGTLGAFVIGRKLVTLRYNQLRKEADFRYSLIHVRTNVESIAFYQGEAQETRRVGARFIDAITNFNLLIGWQRNLGFWTTGYGYFVALIPAIVLAPIYSSGKIDFGTIGRADMAFAQVLAALSIVITSFDTIAAFRAVIRRLGAFNEALDRPATACGNETITTTIGDRISFNNVKVQTPDCSRTLAEELFIDVEPGTGVLIKGPSGFGKSSILRATGGLWVNGSGEIVRPELKDVLFLPQRPYMTQGSLRDQVLYPRGDAGISDADLQLILAQVNLPDLAERVGGFDTVLDWSTVLSMGEQQRLAFARVLVARPKFVFLDESTSALDVANEEGLYKLLAESRVTFISVGHRPTLEKFHKKAIEMIGGGKCRVYDLHSDA